MAPAARQAGVIEAGRLDDAFYEARMSPLRFKLRKLLMAELHREMPLLVAVEVRRQSSVAAAGALTARLMSSRRSARQL